MPARRPALLFAAAALLAVLTGCAGHSAAAPAGPAPTEFPSGTVQQMQHTVDAAQSAADSADSDAATTG